VTWSDGKQARQTGSLATENQERGYGATMGEAAKGWVPQSARGLKKWVVAGLLTEAEAYEVEGVIELAIEMVQSGGISPHFAETLINKIADEMATRCIARLEGKA